MFKVFILFLGFVSFSFAEEALNRITVKIDNKLFVSEYPLNESKGAGFMQVMSGKWHPASESKTGAVMVNFSKSVKLPEGKVDSVGFYMEQFNSITSIVRPIVEIKETKKDNLTKEKKQNLIIQPVSN